VEERLRLVTAFDGLLTKITGYDELDQKIAKSIAKKDSLLLVLQYYELPLHNNASELGVSFNHHLIYRISGTNQIQPLADLVSLKANELNLGWSFPFLSYPVLLRLYKLR
jgi:hypothetical protein